MKETIIDKIPAESHQDLPESALIFEIAAEVCWKMGGIHTVIASKAASMVQTFGMNYFLLGPYSDEVDYTGVLEEVDPETFPEAIGKTITALRKNSIDVHCGYWNIPGKPKVILMNIFKLVEGFEDKQHWLMEQTGVEIPLSKTIHRYINFGFQLTRFFEVLQSQHSDVPTIAHFHEYNAAYAIPIIKEQTDQLGVTLLFSTHATIIGRHLAYKNDDFYQRLSSYDFEEEVTTMGVKNPNAEANARMERFIAQRCDLFLTVSEITALECTHLLGRKPELITPNGFSTGKATDKSREAVRSQILGAFKKHLPDQDIADDPMICLTSGRFEVKNKGYDMVVRALGQVNQQLKKAESNRQILLLMVISAPRLNYTGFRLSLETLKVKIQHRLKRLFGYSKQAVVSHRADTIWDYDPLLLEIKKAKLHNYATDQVKIMYHPDFVKAGGEVFDLDYSELIKGCDLGMFPSFYEPWGYTPLECLFSGVSAVCSDSSGLYQFALDNLPAQDNERLFVANRRAGDDEMSVRQMAEIVLNYQDALHSNQEMPAQDKEIFHWKNLIANYRIAYGLAYEQRQKQVQTT